MQGDKGFNTRNFHDQWNINGNIGRRISRHFSIEIKG